MNYPNYNYNYNNPMYMQNFQDLQNMRDRIDQQMKQMSQPMQNQQPANITQNFQIAPNQQTNTNDIEGKIVKDIEEVKNTLVLKTGVFLTNDYSTLWVKDASGNIRSFNTSEIIELDEKDKQILSLQKDKEENNKTIMLLQAELENIKKSIPQIDTEKTKSKGVDK